MEGGSSLSTDVQSPLAGPACLAGRALAVLSLPFEAGLFEHLETWLD